MAPSASSLLSLTHTGPIEGGQRRSDVKRGASSASASTTSSAVSGGETRQGLEIEKEGGGEKNTNSPFLLAHILFLSSLPVRPVRSSFRLPSVSLSLLLLFSLFLSHTPTKGKEEGSEVCRPSPPAPLFSLSFSIPSYTNCCV